MINGILIVLIVMIVVGTIVLGLSNAENMKAKYIKATIMIAYLVCLAVCIGVISKDTGYRQGQIDALTNNIQYKLVTMPDSTKVWEKITEEVK